jgi:hypothetical protein
MADTAAFFAKKKKGKKKFKSFNANKVDASTVTSTVHVDAPPIAGSTSKLDPNKKEEKKSVDDEEWDTMQINSKNTTVVTNKTQGVTELLDMVALEERRRENEDLSERMEKEATKQALAKAREGMEKQAQEAQKAKEEKEKKNAEKVAKAKPSSIGSIGKYVPMHMRASLMKPRKISGSNSSALNTSDESAFPDLATSLAPKEEKPKWGRP